VVSEVARGLRLATQRARGAEATRTAKEK